MAKVDPSIIDAAQASEKKYGIPASISIAQYALESSWGKKMPPNSNNPFGIKAVQNQPYVSVKTREVDSHGRSYHVMAPFRKFDSIADAFDEHGRLLAQAKPYENARKVLPNADAFADALTGVYATDPKYGHLLKEIMRSSKLYQYDTLQQSEQTVAHTVDAAALANTLKDGSTDNDTAIELADLVKPPEPKIKLPNVGSIVSSIVTATDGATDIKSVAKNLSRDAVNAVLDQAPATVIEHATEATKLKLGEPSTWLGGALVAGSVLADPSVQAAIKPALHAIGHGSWGGLLSAVVGLGLVIARSRQTPRTDAMLAARRLSPLT